MGAEVVGYTDGQADELVIVTHGVLFGGCKTIIGSSVEATVNEGRMEVSEDLDAVRYAEVVQQTEVVGHFVVDVGHVACPADTYVRNEVPNAVLVVTIEQVAEVEHQVLVEVEVLIRVVVSAGVHLLCPNTVKLGTETDAGGKPLTYCDGEAEGATVRTEGIDVAVVLLRGVSSGEVGTSRHEPVSPERVGCYTVLLARNLYILSDGCCGATYNSKRK